MKLLGLVNVDFDVIEQTFCIHQIFEKERKYEAVHQTSRKPIIQIGVNC
jgi:hypothetical protein